MPSAEEWNELLNSAIVVQTTYKGVSGYKITLCGDKCTNVC